MLTMHFNPYTGERRHPLDVRSDPEGVRLVDSDVWLRVVNRRRDEPREVIGVPPIERPTVTFLFDPFTGELRELADITRDPTGRQIVDPHGPVRDRSARMGGQRTGDPGLWAPSWAHVARVMEDADGFTGAAPWWYGWAVQQAFVAGAEFQKTRGNEA